jgi:hypothetical protein
MTRSDMICTLCPILFDRTNQEKSDGQGKWRVQGKGEKYTGCFVERLEESNHLEDLRVQVRIILKMDLKAILWEYVERINVHSDRK